MSASPSVLLGVAVALAIGGGCGGQSEASKANDDVCSAKADIQKQVASLQGMTASTFTVDAVTSDLKAIQTDVTKMEVNTVASTVLKSLSLSDAQAQLQTAASDLAAAYKTSFAKVDCSS